MNWAKVIENKQVWVVCFDTKNEPLSCSVFLTREGAETRVHEALREGEGWEMIDEFIWEHRNGRNRMVIDYAPVGE